MNNLKLHHIGVACRNIEKEFKYFEKLGYQFASEIFVDEEQKIKGVFIKADNQPCLELLENVSEDGPLTSFLQNGVKFYHFAYITKDIEKDYDNLLAQGAIPVVKIIKATYFKRICFVMMKNMMLIELVENK